MALPLVIVEKGLTRSKSHNIFLLISKFLFIFVLVKKKKVLCKLQKHPELQQAVPTGRFPLHGGFMMWTFCQKLKGKIPLSILIEHSNAMLNARELHRNPAILIVVETS